MSAITDIHGFERAQIIPSVTPVDVISDASYLLGPKKETFEDTLRAALIYPAGAGSMMTQLAIHGTTKPEKSIYIEVRNGITQAKVRTMHEPEAGQARDIDPHSPRILNLRAKLARVLGLDELPDFYLSSNDNNLIGPRPLSVSCMDDISFGAREGGMPEEDIERWRDIPGQYPTGLLNIAQALRKFKRYRMGTVRGAVMTVTEDLKYTDTTKSVADDVAVMIRSTNIMANAVVFALPVVVKDAVVDRFSRS